MRMQKGSRSDRVRKQEQRTIAKLRHARRKKRFKQGITVVVPEGGSGFGSVFKGTWKEDEKET